MENILFDIVKKSQAQLHNYLVDYLKGKGYDEIQQDDEAFIYAKGESPILMVAHLDTVHRELPQDVFYDEKQRVLWSPQGIGGDDRAGVYGILKILEHCKPHVIFLHEEEVGGVGASWAANTLNIPKVNFMIELDRKGSDDAVFYDCGNQEFQDHILSFGFKLNYGSFSDISILSPEWDIASVNLSIGYYNEHTPREFIKLDELDATVDKVINIIKCSDSNKFYDFQEVYYPPTKYFTTSSSNFKFGEDEDPEDTAEILNRLFGKDVF